MYIIGIEPKAPGVHIFSQTHMPRLGLPQLLTIALNLGHKCLIFCEEIAVIDWERLREADMILISSTTSTAPRAYSLIEKIRKDYNQKAPILMGGPHVTFLPEEALSKGADYVFRHEADESFASFLAWWKAGHDSSDLLKIPGLSIKIGDRFHHGPQPKRVNLDSLPTPDLDLIHGYKKPFTIPLITSRGCPFDCEFCSEVAMFGHAYRFRSEEKILEDIEFYDARYGRPEIFIADDNLGANRPRLERLCRGMIENDLVRPFSGQIRLDLAKYPGTLRLMTKAGFGRAYIGYESTSQETLEKVGKDIGADDMGKYTKIIQRMGIEIHAMWVLGFDTDTLETIKQNLKAAFKWRLETCQFLILVPIPGSNLFQKLKDSKRIFNPDWSKYDGHHVTFYPAKMTPRQLQVSVMLDAMPKLYSFWQTGRIFVADNFRTAKGFFRLRNWHPVRRTKNSILTLLVRIWGHYTTRRMKKPIRNYIKQTSAMSAEPGHHGS
jgi:anaerobic magnesium-protoporphyrin IX monomethyl ester cyclase